MAQILSLTDAIKRTRKPHWAMKLDSWPLEFKDRLRAEVALGKAAAAMLVRPNQETTLAYSDAIKQYEAAAATLEKRA